MPSGKGRSKEDTWKESDLKKAIQGDKKERSSYREDGRRERTSDRDDDRRRRRDRREDLMNGEDRDHKRKERSSDKEKRRDRDRNGERSGGKSDRDKDRQREREGETSGRERREREQSEKDKESRRDRERHREQDGESTQKDRREKGKREREHEGSEGRRRDDRNREGDKDRERQHRSRRDDDRRSERKLRERDNETGSDDRRQERRRRREEGESSSRRDETRDPKRERSREKDHRDRRKEREHDEARKHRDQSGERREKRRERDDRGRRKEKEKHDVDEENKEDISKPGPSRGDRFRADTLEEADVIDEEEIRTRKSSIIKTEDFNDEAAYNYEEDFEDYEDDFENEQDDEDDTDLSLGDRNAGMQELLNAINLENETVSLEGTKMSRSSDDDSRKESEVRPVTAKGRINFVAAKQKQISEKVASRTRKRGQELMHLIDLDVVVFEMFDLPPMNEYELYIKNFGRSDTKQAYVQCNDDNLEKEIQTEDIETRTMWTQNPAEDFAGCGDEKGSQDDFSSFSHATVDSVRLARFLQTAGQACLVLLEEESAEQFNKIVKDKKDITCSDGYIPLATKQSYLAGRALECLHVSAVQNHLLLTAYGPVTTDQEAASSKMSDNANDKSIICLWNVNEPSTPKTLLICESVPRCCCLSPSKATIAFAGLEDGSVVAWDLRESPSIHHFYNVDSDRVILRSPTFSTAGVLSQDNHHSPVVSLLPVVMPGDSAKASTIVAGNLHSDDMLGLSFQLASLEENAVMNIWVVVELGVADIAGSESDLGLAPGGKIKLIKSSSLQLEMTVRDVRKNTALQTYTMRFLPQDPNHFYIGTDNGHVLHRVRHGGRAHPNTFGPEIECLVDVTALDVSPWQLPCILVGNRDGCVRLYNLNNELPVSTWTHSTQGSSVVSVQWSNSIPSVFFVLDANSILYIWDLLKNDSEPVAIEKVRQGSVTSFQLSSDYSATGVGVAGRNAELILGYKSGLVEVHKISAPFSKASPDDLDRFSDYLEGAL